MCSRGLYRKEGREVVRGRKEEENDAEKSSQDSAG
jgi:hypothetical protein